MAQERWYVRWLHAQAQSQICKCVNANIVPHARELGLVLLVPCDGRVNVWWTGATTEEYMAGCHGRFTTCVPWKQTILNKTIHLTIEIDKFLAKYTSCSSCFH